MNIVEEKWQEIIEKLRVEHSLSDISFRTWILPLKIEKVTTDTVFILTTLNGSVDYIERKYKAPLTVCIAEITNQEYEINFITEDDISQETNKSTLHTSSGSISPNILEKAHINSLYTFETFVVGNNNDFAQAAALRVAESPGIRQHNPLFLHGGAGLGKTHLMHSIGHYILENDPTKKVLYVTSESFMNELIDVLKDSKSGNESLTSNFRKKYREIDVLLIDDIQFIIGKESTQAEFFNTFNELQDGNKQVVISSDKSPKEFKTLDERFKTRFKWGLVADLSAPNYETRMAILIKKIESGPLQYYNIPKDVLDYIATNVTSNVRELEGSINKLIALSKIERRPIDIPLVAEALKDFISPNENRTVTADLIVHTVADHFNLTVENLESAKRNANLVLPRQIAMYLCSDMTELSLESIGAVLGKRNHSTISHGITKIINDKKNNESLENTISIIKKKINPF